MGAKVSRRGSYNLEKREKKNKKKKGLQVSERAASFISLSQAQIYEDEAKSPLPELTKHQSLQNIYEKSFVTSTNTALPNVSSSKPDSERDDYSNPADEKIYDNILEDGSDFEEQTERRDSNIISLLQPEKERQDWENKVRRDSEAREKYSSVSSYETSELSRSPHSWKEVMNGNFWNDHATLDQNSFEDKTVAQIETTSERYEKQQSLVNDEWLDQERNLATINDDGYADTIKDAILRSEHQKFNANQQEEDWQEIASSEDGEYQEDVKSPEDNSTLQNHKLSPVINKDDASYFNNYEENWQQKMQSTDSDKNIEPKDDLWGQVELIETQNKTSKDASNKAFSNNEEDHKQIEDQIFNSNKDQGATETLDYLIIEETEPTEAENYFSNQKHATLGEEQALPRKKVTFEDKIEEPEALQISSYQDFQNEQEELATHQDIYNQEKYAGQEEIESKHEEESNHSLQTVQNDANQVEVSINPHRLLTKSISSSSDMYYEVAEDKPFEESESEEQELFYDAEGFDEQVELIEEPSINGIKPLENEHDTQWEEINLLEISSQISNTEGFKITEAVNKEEEEKTEGNVKGLVEEEKLPKTEIQAQHLEDLELDVVKENKDVERAAQINTNFEDLASNSHSATEYQEHSLKINANNIKDSLNREDKTFSNYSPTATDSGSLQNLISKHGENNHDRTSSILETKEEKVPFDLEETDQSINFADCSQPAKDLPGENVKMGFMEDTKNFEEEEINLNQQQSVEQFDNLIDLSTASNKTPLANFQETELYNDLSHTNLLIGFKESASTPQIINSLTATKSPASIFEENQELLIEINKNLTSPESPTPVYKENHQEENLQKKPDNLFLPVNTRESTPIKEQLSPKSFDSLFITTPEEVAEDQMRIWRQQTDKEVEEVIKQIEDIITDINKLRIEINNLGTSEEDKEMQTEMYQILIKKMRDVNNINNHDFHEKVIDLQHKALNKVHQCLRELQMKGSS